MFTYLSPFIFLFLLLQCGVFFFALQKCQKNQFYSDVPFVLCLFGIFVWGDALIIAPFWAVSSILFIFISPLNIVRYFFLFATVRSAYEVVYWIAHQFSGKKYRAPLFRNISWITDDQSAILYQVLQTCQFVLWIALLIGSFIRWK
jgi:hypothetical protein